MLKEKENNLPRNAIASDAMATLELARKSHEQYLVRSSSQDLTSAIDYYIQTIKIDPNLPETYYRLATLLWQDGQISLDSAIEQCKMASELDPRSFNAHIYSGYFLNLAKRYGEAEDEFKQAIKINPLMSARPRLVLAFMSLRQMNEEKVSFSKFAQTMYYLFSGSLMMAWDYASLRMFYRNFSEDFAVFMHKLVGQIFETINNSNLAIKAYSHAAQITGRNEIFYTKLADVAIKRNKPEEAIKAYKMVLQSNPNNREVLIKLATTMQVHDSENYDDIIDCFNKLVHIDTETHRYYYELGHLYLDKRDNLNAINAFKLALKEDEENPFYHNSLAFSLVQVEQYDDAIEHYNKAINLNPDNKWTAIVAQALASIYYEIKDKPELASSVYQMALVLDPHSTDSYLAMGDIYLGQSDFDSAIRCYCEAIKLEPEYARAYGKCGIALWEKEFVEEAIVAYSKAIELEPEYDIAYNNLGVIYLDGIGNTKEAIRLCTRAVELNQNYTLAYFNIARAYQVEGNVASSAKYYQMALDLNKISNNLDEEDVQQRLHQLFEV